ncbi:MAG: hypothetical protein RL660_2231, partial [Bacteroidota bacterium]
LVVYILPLRQRGHLARSIATNLLGIVLLAILLVGTKVAVVYLCSL